MPQVLALLLFTSCLSPSLPINGKASPASVEQRLESARQRARTLYEETLPDSVLTDCSVTEKAPLEVSLATAGDFRRMRLPENARGAYSIFENKVYLASADNEEALFHESAHVFHRGLSRSCLDELAAYFATALAKEKGLIK